jgi:hypothetical protein
MPHELVKIYAIGMDFLALIADFNEVRYPNLVDIIATILCPRVTTCRSWPFLIGCRFEQYGLPVPLRRRSGD